MFTISFLLTAICFGLVIQGHKKPMLQVVPMIFSFLGWLGFCIMEYGVDEELARTRPSAPIRLDLLMIVPLLLFSVVSLVIFYLPTKKSAQKPSSET